MHRALCPYTVFITSMGAWKLGGLSLSCPSFITPDTAGVIPVSYRDASMERFMRYQQVGAMPIDLHGSHPDPSSILFACLSYSKTSQAVACGASVTLKSLSDRGHDRDCDWVQPPLGYVAPELANADGHTATTCISTAADVFSLGQPLQSPSRIALFILHLYISQRTTSPRLHKRFSDIYQILISLKITQYIFMCDKECSLR